MTVEEVVREAMGRLHGIADVSRTPGPTMYRRVGLRQQQLFSRIAQADQEYTGTWADGTLDADARLDLKDLLDPLPAAGRITRIEIKDRGSSSYTNGQNVQIVNTNSAEFRGDPRVTIRDYLVEGYTPPGQNATNDLDGVTSLRVYYPRMPAALDGSDKAKEIELESPWDEMLVLDLAIWLIRRAPDVSLADRGEAIGLMGAEMAELDAEFEEHFTRFQPRVGVTPMVW